MKFIIIFLFAFSIFSGCTKDSEDNQVDIFGFDSIENAKMTIGEYANYGIYTDGSFNLDLIHNVFSDQADYFARFDDGQQNRINGGDYILNDTYEITFIEEWSGYGLTSHDLTLFSSINYLKKFYGQENRLSLIKNDTTLLNHTFYTPQDILLEKNIFGEFIQGTSFYRIKRSDATLFWNEDDKNNEGILIHLWWDGAMYPDENSKPHNGTNVTERAVLLEDKGEGKLPAKFFDGLPENARFTLFIYRGTNEIVKIFGSESSVRISLNSRVTTRFVLNE